MEYPKKYQSFHINVHSKIVVLLLHGFTCSPYSFRSFAKLLTREGFSVFAKQIAGHGTNPSHLAATSFHDWRQSVSEAIARCSENYDEIFILGHSLGAALALDYVSRHPKICRGVIAVAPPLMIRRQRIHRILLPFMGLVKKFHPKKIDSFVENGFNDIGSYPVIPLNALKELYSYIDHVFHPCLSLIRDPVLILQPDHDDILDPVGASIIFQKIQSKKKSLIILQNAPHLPFQRETLNRIIAETAIDFIKKFSIIIPSDFQNPKKIQPSIDFHSSPSEFEKIFQQK